VREVNKIINTVIEEANDKMVPEVSQPEKTPTLEKME
jgi:hypothetical protein